jgi:hypothetical protein
MFYFELKRFDGAKKPCLALENPKNWIRVPSNFILDSVKEVALEDRELNLDQIAFLYGSIDVVDEGLEKAGEDKPVEEDKPFDGFVVSINIEDEITYACKTDRSYSSNIYVAWVNNINHATVYESYGASQIKKTYPDSEILPAIKTVVLKGSSDEG